MAKEYRKAPRLKEQYKDNAFEVNKNLEARDDLLKHGVQKKENAAHEGEECRKH